MIDRTSPRAVVFGSVHMDLIAKADRLPGRGESVAGGSFSMSPGGKGGNQAMQLALAGIESRMLTRLGDDAFGRELAEALKARGVDTSLISIDREHATGASTVFAAEGDYCSIIASGAAARITAAMIDEAAPALRGADALLLQLELPVDLALHAAHRAAAAGRMVVLNASPAPDSLEALPAELCNAVSLLVVNRVEAGRLLGFKDAPEDYGEAALALQRKLGGKDIVVTAGSAGSVACVAGQLYRQPGFPAKLVDTVGAGDAYLGTLTAARLRGLAWPEALRRASAAGAIAVSRSGACESLPTSAEVDRFLADV